METKTKKLLVAKVNAMKKIDSLSGLQKEITPLLDKISKEECPKELKELELIIDAINKILSDSAQKDHDKNLLKTKNEISNVLCDLLCF